MTIPDEPQEQVDYAIRLKHELDLHETLWTGGLYPIENIVSEIRTIIKILEGLLPFAPNRKPVEQYIARMNRKLRKYLKEVYS